MELRPKNSLRGVAGGSKPLFVINPWYKSRVRVLGAHGLNPWFCNSVLYQIGTYVKKWG